VHPIFRRKLKSGAMGFELLLGGRERLQRNRCRAVLLAALAAAVERSCFL
jgi:hypothetical protein